MMNNDDYVNLVSKILIEHSRFTMAIRQMERSYLTAIQNGDPFCVAVVGESGTGKTRTLEYFESLHGETQHKDYTEIPVLRVSVNAKPTIKGLAEEILRALGDPLAHKGTENEKTERIITLMRGTRTYVLLLDEFQHFSDQGGRHIQHHVADWLKVLVDEMRIGLVVSGITRTLNIIQKNEQLARRFYAPIIMKPFDWNIDEERYEFIAFLSELKPLVKPFVFPNLSYEEVAFRMHKASNGYIGHLMKIIQSSIMNAICTNTKTITMKDLNVAFTESIWGEIVTCNNPFTGSIESILATEGVTHVGKMSKVYKPSSVSEIL